MLFRLWVPKVDSKARTLVGANAFQGIDKSSMLACVSFSKEGLTFVSHSLNKVVMLRLLIFSNARLAELIVAGTTVDPSDPQVTSVSMALNFQGIFIGGAAGSV